VIIQHNILKYKDIRKRTKRIPNNGAIFFFLPFFGIAEINKICYFFSDPKSSDASIDS